MKIVTENNTKKEILSAYSEALELLKASEGIIVDPAKEMSMKKAGETLTKATETVGLNVEDQIAKLQKSVASILGNLANSFTEEIKTFNDLQEAIALKESELKELFDIEKEAFALTALVNANRETKDKFKAAFDEDKARMQAELDQLKADLKAEKAAHLNETYLQDEEVKRKRARDQEEYTYDFARKKQLDDNDWEDEKKVREKQLSELESEVKTRLELVTTREETIDDLKAKVEEIPQLVDAARKAGEAEGEKKAGTSFGFEKRAIESKTTSEKTILENKVAMLEAQLNKANDELTRLNEDLKTAYSKIQETATAAIESQANSRMVNSLEALVKDKTQK